MNTTFKKSAVGIFLSLIAIFIAVLFQFLYSGPTPSKIVILSLTIGSMVGCVIGALAAFEEKLNDGLFFQTTFVIAMAVAITTATTPVLALYSTLVSWLAFGATYQLIIQLRLKHHTCKEN